MLGLLLASCSAAPGPATAGDRVEITIDEALRGEEWTGRVILMFITETDPRWSMRQPLDGPWLANPQPIASIAVIEWEGSDAVVVSDDLGSVFGGPLDALDGPVRVQALLHVNDDRPRLVAGTGCLYSDVVSFDAGAEEADRVEIALSRRLDEVPERALPHNLRIVSVRSELLSSVMGRDIEQQCYVALPRSYDERENARWPVVFVIPDRLDSAVRSAIEHARMLAVPGVEEIAPHAVHVVLDPQTAHGHHGFIDSAFHGDRVRALIEELIPHLEQEFRLHADREARLVTGIGLGAWSAIWLTLNCPDVFGACWATAPTPVDFHAFQEMNLHRAANAFVNSDREPYRAYRRTAGLFEMTPAMTSQQMWEMERAIDPDGRSGGLWQTLMRLYGPVETDTGRIIPLFDGRTGEINEDVREHWMQYDIARLVRSDPQRYLPILAERVHLFCGELDSFYFDRAIRRLRDVLREVSGDESDSTASILMIDGATHENVQRHVFDDWNRQMREHLQRHDVNVD